MIQIRRSAERGHFDHGWLDTYHTFSFGGYRDPAHNNFRRLRVMNDDRVAPGHGFPMHDHDNMEIVTVVLSGTLEHRDSLGNGAQIKPGDVQRMSAGTGISHSEFNPSREEPCHLMQIWIYPGQKGLPPSYEQKNFSQDSKRNKLLLVGSSDGRDGSVTIQQDVSLYSSALDAGTTVAYQVSPDRYAWVQVTEGKISLNGEELSAGDGAGISSEQELAIYAQQPSELLLFDLA